MKKDFSVHVTRTILFGGIEYDPLKLGTIIMTTSPVDNFNNVTLHVDQNKDEKGNSVPLIKSGMSNTGALSMLKEFESRRAERGTTVFSADKPIYTKKFIDHMLNNIRGKKGWKEIDIFPILFALEKALDTFTGSDEGLNSIDNTNYGFKEQEFFMPDIISLLRVGEPFLEEGEVSPLCVALGKSHEGFNAGERPFKKVPLPEVLFDILAEFKKKESK